MKVAVVTGSNKGIGLAIVRALCKQYDGIVYLTARSQERGLQAVKTLELEGLKPKFHLLDIESPESIEKFKKYIISTYGSLDVLVNNAGIAYSKASTVPFIDQVKSTIGVNFMGTLNVSRALIPLVAEHGRIVNISSFMGRLNQVSTELRERFSDPRLTETELVGLMERFVTDVIAGKHVENGWGSTALGMSKIGVIALTKINARELVSGGKNDVIINTCCPGYCKTDMSQHKGDLTPDEGALTPVHLALLPPGSPSGQLWKLKQIVEW